MRTNKNGSTELTQSQFKNLSLHEVLVLDRYRLQVIVKKISQKNIAIFVRKFGSQMYEFRKIESLINLV